VPREQPGQGPRIRQEIQTRRDAYTAGRNLIVNFAAGAVQAAAPGMLPRDVLGFTGRASELKRLTGLANSGSVAVAAIDGTAGVGKTALAVHAAYQLLPQFPGGHLYADMRGYTEGQAAAEPGEVLDVFLRRLGVPADELPTGVEEQSGLLRHLLAARQMLLVLDNAAAEAQVRPLLPGAGSSLVLITSRSTLTGLEVDERIDLDVFPDAQASALLAQLIGQDRAAAEPDAVRQVVHWCGCLPLALRIAGQLLAAHPAWPVTRLAGMLADERHRLDRLAAGDRQVAAAFGVSYRQLADGDARMFRLLGLHTGPDFDAAIAAALADVEPGAAEQVLDRLALAHLIIENLPGRFRMHDLLRLFAHQTCLAEDDNAARGQAAIRLVDHFQQLAAYLDGYLDAQLRSPLAEAATQAGEPLPAPQQALALFEAERRNLLAAVTLAADQGQHEKVWQLSEDMGEALTFLRHLDDLLTVRQAALSAAQAAGDTAAESGGLNNLGLAYAKLRRFEEAFTCHEQDLAICRETGDRPGEGQALTNLGDAYRKLRQFDEAITCQQDALAIMRETGEQSGEVSTLTNLGNTYWDLRQFDEAITCHQDALAIIRETGDRHSEGQSLDNLGNAYRELGQLEEAVTCHQDAMAIIRETGDRHSEGMALSNLGLTYQELRRFKKAITCYEQSLAICRETGDRYGEGSALTNLGNAYRSRRRFAKAVTCHQDAVAIFGETGDRHSEGMALTNLGNAYLGRLRFKEAVTCYEQALAICRETGDRYSEALRLTNLGYAYQALRQSDKARACWQDAIVAIRESGDSAEKARLEQALNAQLQHGRRRWSRRGDHT
jgi:tetratricopeptide (TPR) repeat protein